MLKNKVIFKLVLFREMSKKLKTKAESSKTSLQQDNSPFKVDKDTNILIQIYAKPGSKKNSITGITAEGVNVQINAPPTAGAANSELVKYIASVLGLRPANVLLDRGHKSRQKVLKVSKLTLDEVNQKISEEIEN